MPANCRKAINGFSQMDNLRWILLGVGAVVILGIYLFARLKTLQFRLPAFSGGRKRPMRKAPPRVEDLDVEDGAAAPVDEFEALFLDEQQGQPEEMVLSRPVKKPRQPVNVDQVFSLFVTAPPGVPFRGPLLLGALNAARLEFGDMNIFHRIELVDGVQKTLFSAANIREPGTFDLSAMEDFTTGGIAFFMQVHNGVDAVWAFEAMVESSRILAESLGGTVCDATRSVLTKQTISHMREAVIGCQLQQRMAKTAS